MFADPNNPFAAAAPKNGSAPSPFQPAPLNGVHHSHASPFEQAPGRLPEARPPQPNPAAGSPFALVNKVPEPRLAEPSEGFAAADPVPVSMPQISQGSNGRDPFAAPNHFPQSSQSSDARQEASGNAAPKNDFVIPAERSAPAQLPPVREEIQQAAPQQAAPQQAQQAQQYYPQAPQHQVAPAIHGEMPQLVLRAIFGVTQELNRSEIIQRARTLPGVRNLHLIGSEEAQAMSVLRKSVARMGFGDQHSLSLHSDAGVVDIIEESGATLAVLHEGSYGAGVRETLIIVARELARLT